uniref:Mating pheromone receptor a1 n=1 Tax=Sporobolomyces pararoseus TaxID=5003 RepID=G8H2W8_9BASI|nr:mating pheromone receptor a1 [Sporobolomyces pararoseus]
MFGPVFVVFNFLSIFFLILPSSWHLRARNTATLTYIFWCLVNVLPLAINSLVWRHRSDITAPIYCDIVTKLRVGGEVGIPASILCLTRQLESIAAARQAYFNEKDRRRRRIEELALGLGFPFLVMILHTVVQGHRYDIVERVGCVVAVYWSLPAVLLVQIWGIVFLLASCVYAALAARLFLARRKQFASVLESSKSAISTSRFVRLIALSVVEIAFALPILLFLRLYSLIHEPLLPYVNWAFVHENFGNIYHTRIDMLEVNVPQVAKAMFEISYWLYPVSSTLFFLFFGLGDEAISTYREWGKALKNLFPESAEVVPTESSIPYKQSLFATLPIVSLDQKWGSEKGDLKRLPWSS